MEKEAGTAKITVPLTNWKRLSNAPIELSWASVVHWRDFVVVYTGSQVLLYNPKWNIWSTLLPNVNTVEKPAQGCPIVVYGDKLLFLSLSGQIYEFKCKAGKWEVNKSMDPSIDSRHNIISAVLACHGETMFLICSARMLQQLTQKTHAVNTGNSDIFVQTFTGGSKSWSNPTMLQMNVLKSDLPIHLSVAAKDSKMLYVSTGHDIYSLLFEPAPDAQQSATTTAVNVIPTPSQGILSADSNKDMAPVVTTVQVACPPQKMYTLCVINDCLFAFGGKDSDNQPFSSIYQYDTEAEVWNLAGNMCTARYGVATVVFNREEESLLDIFVMGGYLGEHYVSQSLAKLTCRIVDHCEVSIKTTKND